MTKTIKVKYAKPDTKRLQRINVGDWIDLAIDEDVEIQMFGQFKKVSLGIAMELPAGYEAIIAERSSTHRKWGVDLANGIGVIDNAFKGDKDIWAAELVANRDNVSIPRGTRVLQFRIQKTQLHDDEIIFNEVETLGNRDRGGFGSTGD